MLEPDSLAVVLYMWKGKRLGDDCKDKRERRRLTGRTHSHTLTHSHTHTLTHTHILTRTLTRTYTHTQTLTYTYTHILYIRTHTHTHTHMKGECAEPEVGVHRSISKSRERRGPGKGRVRRCLPCPPACERRSKSRWEHTSPPITPCRDAASWSWRDQVTMSICVPLLPSRRDTLTLADLVSRAITGVETPSPQSATCVFGTAESHTWWEMSEPERQRKLTPVFARTARTLSCPGGLRNEAMSHCTHTGDSREGNPSATCLPSRTCHRSTETPPSRRFAQRSAGSACGASQRRPRYVLSAAAQDSRRHRTRNRVCLECKSHKDHQGSPLPGSRRTLE